MMDNLLLAGCTGAEVCQQIDCSGTGACLNNIGFFACDCEEGYHPSGIRCFENVDCITKDVDARDNILNYPSDMPDAVGDTISGGVYDCAVTSSNASSGGSGRYQNVLFISGNNIDWVPTDGRTTSCGVGGVQSFRVMFTDGYSGDNSGSASFNMDGTDYDVSASQNLLHYTSDMPDAVGGNLAGGLYRCRVTSSDASYGSPYKEMLWVSGTSSYVIPTDGEWVRCNVGGTGDYRLMFTDGYTADNSGSATVQVCPE